MARALIVVDIQRDFCEGGSLAVVGGNQAARRISRLITQNEDSHLYDWVVATKDWHIKPGTHFSDEPDFVDSWPKHCVALTDGAKFHNAIDSLVMMSQNHSRFIHQVFYKGEYSAAYSGFEGFGAYNKLIPLKGWLDQRGVDKVDICGIALDYCVKQTALDAARYGYKTRVLTDLSPSVHPNEDEATLDELERAGVTVL